MHVVVIGSTGQLGSDLIPQLKLAGHHVSALTHQDIDVTEYASVRHALDPLRPSVVINTAAYHRVDDAEDHPELAMAVNAVGVRHLAVACRELDATLVHLSTDYIFSGTKGRPYVESDPPDPLNVYGVSKVAGELVLRALWPKHVIVRTSGLYGVAGSSGKGGNFVESMLQLAAAGRPIRVVNDQTFTPTSTSALARQLTTLLHAGTPGTYHATCQGACTWYEFAAEIFRCSGLNPSCAAQTTAERGARAARPPYSVLENAALTHAGIDQMPPWQEALREYLRSRTAAKAVTS